MSWSDDKKLLSWADIIGWQTIKKKKKKLQTNKSNNNKMHGPLPKRTKKNI